jgi:hypothetical protein
VSALVRVGLGLVVLAGALRRPRERPPAPPPRPRGFAGRYGASPLHLLAHLAALCVALLVVARLVDAREAGNILLWFALAVVLHDAVLWPLYATLDRLAARRAHGPSVNYVRIPVALSALLLLVFFPLVLGCSSASFARVAGREPEGQLTAWLAISAALFAGSALLWLLRGRRQPRASA